MWLVSATTNDGRRAILDFSWIDFQDAETSDYDAVRVYTITDRPVYRPTQTVKFKAWVRETRYDLGDRNKFSRRKFLVTIIDARQSKIYEKWLTGDEHGGLDDEFTLGEAAALGAYQISVNLRKGEPLGGGAFRVEEYKKPEFEVTIDAPTEPAALGEKITATVKAKYYFGAPVTTAKVKYKVTRHEHDGRWFPAWRWDWLYGSGTWWFGGNHDWYPGFERWGCLPPPSSAQWPVRRARSGDRQRSRPRS